MGRLLVAGCLLALAMSGAAWAGATFSGGDGSSRDNAVVIDASNESEGVQAEYEWIKDHLPGAQIESTSLIDKDGKVYDSFEVTLASGETRTLWFDITAYFGKM